MEMANFSTSSNFGRYKKSPTSAIARNIKNVLMLPFMKKIVNPKAAMVSAIARETTTAGLYLAMYGEI